MKQIAYTNKSQMLKSLAIALIIVVLLTISMCTLFTPQLLVSAHSPAWSIPTQSYINVTPNPVGVGQQVTISIWLNEPPPTANGTYGDRWQNMTVRYVKPDGSTTTLGPFSSDETGKVVVVKATTQVGPHSFWMTFGGQTLAGDNLAPGTTNPFIGDYYQPSNSSVFMFTVQKELVNITATPSPSPPPTPTTPPTENFWMARPPMPQSGTVGTAVVNGKIYAIGLGGTNQEYDPATLTWTIKTPLPNPYVGGIAAYQNTIYVIGENYTEVYDVATDTWTSKTPMPTWRTGMQANVVNDKIYLIGEMSDESGKMLGITEVYDTVTDTWTTKAPLPTPVYGYASAVVDNKIYIIGGDCDPPIIISDQVQIYDPEADSWSFGKPMPTPVRIASAGATIGMFAPKRIYVIGGLQNGYGLSINQVYDTQSDSWTVGASMPTARYSLSVAVLNDTLYALGGVLLPPYAFPKDPLATNEVYLPLGYDGPIPPYWVPLSSPSPSSTVSPTPSLSTTPTPSATTVLATTDIGATVELTINGNVTSSQMSNIAIISNQSASSTTLSFTITGQSGTTGFGNLTIPKSAVIYGTTPISYVDNQSVSNQGFTQDSSNYYVWYTTHFSTHEVLIVFTAIYPSPSPSEQSSLSQEAIYGIAAAVAIVASVVFVLLLQKNKKRNAV